MIATGPLESASDPVSWRPIEGACAGSLTAARCSFGGVGAIALELSFTGRAGTIGRAETEGLVLALELAVRDRVGVAVSIASAGIRMSEGAAAFVRLQETVAAASAVRRSGLPYVAFLDDPAMGGALVGIASMAQLRFAAPHARIALLGRRIGGPDITSPVAARHGQVDGVVEPVRWRETLVRLFAVLCSDSNRGAEPYVTPADLWQAETGEGVVGMIWSRFVRDATCVRGDRTSGEDPSVRAAICSFAGVPAMVVGASASAGRRVSVAGLRIAARAFELAEELRLPVVTLVDVSGPEATTIAEWAALPDAVATAIVRLQSMTTPTLAVLLGDGAGATALALASARRVIATGDSWLGPLSPGQAAELLYSDPGASARAASEQRLGAQALLEDGVVDRVLESTDQLVGEMRTLAAGRNQLPAR